MTTSRTMLSEHFSLDEMTYSRVAVENGLDNTPSPAARLNLQYLVTHLLEPLRALYGKPIAILSGFRNETVNRLVGGVSRSQHQTGEAADCYTPDVPGLLQALKQSGLLFDQAILYGKRNFLHLSLKAGGDNRRQVLFYLLCLVLILSGCGVPKKTEYGELRQISSAWVEKKDTLFRNGHLSAVDSMNWEVREVILSVPDSLGRQYPEKITVLEADRYRILIDTSRVTHAINTKATQQQTAFASYTHCEKRVLNRGNYVLWIALALLILVGVTFKQLKMAKKN